MSDGDLRELRLQVNGSDVRADVEPRLTLLDFVREELRLGGTHAGCEQGACGACTVLLDGEAVRSCLLFAVQLEGREITTIEGLAAPAAEELHPGAAGVLGLPRPPVRVLHARDGSGDCVASRRTP